MSSPELQPCPAPFQPAPPPETGWVHRHARGVFRFLRTLGAPIAVAEDLTQEAFVIAWRKQKQDLPAAALATFLQRTAKLSWLEHCRDRRREGRARAAVAERLWQQECAHDGGDAFSTAVQRCLAQLAPRARQALEQVYGEGVDRDAVAARLGLQPNGLKMLLQRARQTVLGCVRRNP
ncbi:MAG TPA: sigma-70 family RNA polymerase sigma factor [Planctomycetota bacterium]|nr:sigma-70 family RNA polymerase sigma factor [Planctomycetota bacterium]